MKDDKTKREKISKSLSKERENIRSIARKKIYDPEEFQAGLVNQLFNKKEEIIIMDPWKYYRTIEVFK